MNKRLDQNFRPVALYGLSPAQVDRAQLNAEIDESGMDCQYFENEAQLDLLLQNPRIFCVFIDLEDLQNFPRDFLNKIRSTGCQWIVLAKVIKTHQAQALYAAGASEILQYPAHPITLKNRTRMLLSTFLKTQDLPEDTILPPGIMRRTQENPDTGSTFEPSPVYQTLHGKPTLAKPVPTIHAFANENSRTYIRAQEYKISAHPKRSSAFASVKNQMAQKAMVLKGDRRPDQAAWPEYLVNLRDLPLSKSTQDMSASQKFLRKVFSDTSDILGAVQIFLFSLKPHILSDDMPPELLYTLVHSKDPLIDANPSLPSELFPQIEIALEKSNPLGVNETTPQQVGGAQREAVWCQSAQSEEASIVIPLYDLERPFAVILIQLSHKIGQDFVKLVEDATYIFQQTRTQCLMLDYFGRLYRKT